MPFVAKRKGTGERLDITLIENPRRVLKPGECVCQVCDTPMIVKAGLVRQHHFAHVGRCSGDYQSHPESPAHQDAKRFLAANLREQFREYVNTAIEYEVPLPEVRRIADLMVTFPTGWRVAHEVQLASITTEQLQERTNDYTLAGIDRLGLQSAASHCGFNQQGEAPIGFSPSGPSLLNVKQRERLFDIQIGHTGGMGNGPILAQF